MLLAAGRGSRLKPLTDTVPKPLISIGKYCLIEYHLYALQAAGIHEVVINVCYYADKIMQFLGDGRRYGLQIHYSQESECLGTGGGIYRALDILGPDPFLLLSADIWLQFPFVKLTTCPVQDAHLILTNNPPFHPEGDYGLNREKQVSFAEPKFTYAGIAVLHPRLFIESKAGVFSFTSVLNKAIEKGQVTGELYEGAWFNVGTQEELDRLVENLQVQKNLL